MIDNGWSVDLESEIYTILKTRAKAQLVTAYPHILFTQKEKRNDDAQFPTVRILFIGSPESGQTLEGDGINAIRSTIEIKITVNGELGLTALRNIQKVMMAQLKLLMFDVTTRQTLEDETNDTTMAVIRASRLIGASETF